MNPIRAVLSVLLLAFTLPSLAQEPVVLRFSQLVPPTHPYHTGILVPWVADVARATNGRVKVEITTAPLGPMARNYDLVQQGIADLAGGNHLLSPGRFQITQIAQTQVGTDSPEAVSVAFWRTYKRFLEKANEHTGTHVLSLHVSGAMHIFTTNREVRLPADLKGQKFLVPGTVAGNVATSLGAVPVTRAVPEYYDVVSKGVVDGLFGTNSAVNGFKVEPFMKFQVEIPGGYHFSSFFVVVNKAKWDALPRADRDAIESVSGEAYAKLAGKTLGKQQDDILAARRTEAKMKTTVADAALLADLRKAIGAFDSEWTAAAKAKGIDGEGAMKYFREQAAAYKP